VFGGDALFVFSRRSATAACGATRIPYRDYRAKRLGSLRAAQKLPVQFEGPTRDLAEDAQADLSRFRSVRRAA